MQKHDLQENIRSIVSFHPELSYIIIKEAVAGLDEFIEKEKTKQDHLAYKAIEGLFNLLSRKKKFPAADVPYLLDAIMYFFPNGKPKFSSIAVNKIWDMFVEAYKTMPRDSLWEEIRGAQSYVEKYIKPKLDSYMQSGLFRSDDIPGGYGHRDGVRGIVTDELHMRSGIGLAYALKAYDINTGNDHYMSTKWYRELCAWIDSMKADDGSYYEYETALDRKKYGKGSAGQYLPVLWILGTLLK